MSSIPAVVENEARANAQRAPREETRSSPETKFQDAIDSRRASRAHAAEKEARAHRSERTSDDRATAPHDDHDSVRADDDGSQSASSGSASEPSSSTRDASTPRAERPSATAAREAPESTRHAARTSEVDARAVSKDANDGADESALAAAPTNANALEALLARTVPHADAIGGSAAAAPGVAHVDAVDSANDESDDGGLLGATSAMANSANTRASGDVTLASDVLRALTHAARDTA